MCRRYINRDAAWLTVLDQLAQQRPLPLSPELAVLHLRITVDRVESTIRSSAQREAIDARCHATIVEDEDRPTTRCKDRR